MYSPIAQLVEQMTVNHWVAGSSPARGANLIYLSLNYFSLLRKNVNLILAYYEKGTNQETSI